MFEYITYKDKRGNDEFENWIKELAEKSKASKHERIQLKKIFEYLEILRMNGTRAGEKYIKHLEGNIWELRPLENRILYAYWKDNIFILLHHFKKKTQKTPQREIQKAKNNLNDFLERNEIHYAKKN